MDFDQIILGKKILVVDDEKDILETISDLLADCKLDMASNYEQAAEMLKYERYDLAILDIMGVDGYGLLKLATEKHIPKI